MESIARNTTVRIDDVALAFTAGMGTERVLVSAIIPCLNEELTLGICISKAFNAFSMRGIKGEVVVGDNGSADKSVEIAQKLGARVVHQPVKGYGAAISAAVEAAEGKYLIMADADDS